MRSTQRSLCAAMLSLQTIVLGLTTPVLVSVEAVDTGVALAIGLGLAAACVVAAGLLRSPVGYGLGWAVQAASLALGVVIPMMVILGVVFTSLWAGAYFLGRKIDREKAERAVLEEQWAAEHPDARVSDAGDGDHEGEAGAGGTGR
jgi:hypothetical protein